MSGFRRFVQKKCYGVSLSVITRQIKVWKISKSYPFSAIFARKSPECHNGHTLKWSYFHLFHLPHAFDLRLSTKELTFFVLSALQISVLSVSSFHNKQSLQSGIFVTMFQDYFKIDLDLDVCVLDNSQNQLCDFTFNLLFILVCNILSYPCTHQLNGFWLWFACQVLWHLQQFRKLKKRFYNYTLLYL